MRLGSSYSFKPFSRPTFRSTETIGCFLFLSITAGFHNIVDKPAISPNHPSSTIHLPSPPPTKSLPFEPTVSQNWVNSIIFMAIAWAILLGVAIVVRRAGTRSVPRSHTRTNSVNRPRPHLSSLPPTTESFEKTTRLVVLGAESISTNSGARIATQGAGARLDARPEGGDDDDPTRDDDPTHNNDDPIDDDGSNIREDPIDDEPEEPEGQDSGTDDTEENSMKSLHVSAGQGDPEDPPPPASASPVDDKPFKGFLFYIPPLLALVIAALWVAYRRLMLFKSRVKAAIASRRKIGPQLANPRATNEGFQSELWKPIALEIAHDNFHTLALLSVAPVHHSAQPYTADTNEATPAPGDLLAFEAISSMPQTRVTVGTAVPIEVKKLEHPTGSMMAMRPASKAPTEFKRSDLASMEATPDVNSNPRESGPATLTLTPTPKAIQTTGTRTVADNTRPAPATHSFQEPVATASGNSVIFCAGASVIIGLGSAVWRLGRITAANKLKPSSTSSGGVARTQKSSSPPPIAPPRKVDDEATNLSSSCIEMDDAEVDLDSSSNSGTNEGLDLTVSIPIPAVDEDFSMALGEDEHLENALGYGTENLTVVDETLGVRDSEESLCEPSATGAKLCVLQETTSAPAASESLNTDAPLNACSDALPFDEHSASELTPHDDGDGSWTVVVSKSAHARRRRKSPPKASSSRLPRAIDTKTTEVEQSEISPRLNQPIDTTGLASPTEAFSTVNAGREAQITPSGNTISLLCPTKHRSALAQDYNLEQPQASIRDVPPIPPVGEEAYDSSNSVDNEASIPAVPTLGELADGPSNQDQDGGAKELETSTHAILPVNDIPKPLLGQEIARGASSIKTSPAIDNEVDGPSQSVQDVLDPTLSVLVAAVAEDLGTVLASPDEDKHLVNDPGCVTKTPTKTPSAVDVPVSVSTVCLPRCDLEEPLEPSAVGEKLCDGEENTSVQAAATTTVDPLNARSEALPSDELSASEPTPHDDGGGSWTIVVSKSALARQRRNSQLGAPKPSSSRLPRAIDTKTTEVERPAISPRINQPNDTTGVVSMVNAVRDARAVPSKNTVPVLRPTNASLTKMSSAIGQQVDGSLKPVQHVPVTSMHAVVPPTDLDDKLEGLESSMHAVALANDTRGQTRIPRVTAARIEANTPKTPPMMQGPTVDEKAGVSSIPVRNPGPRGIGLPIPPRKAEHHPTPDPNPKQSQVTIREGLSSLSSNQDQDGAAKGLQTSMHAIPPVNDTQKPPMDAPHVTGRPIAQEIARGASSLETPSAIDHQVESSSKLVQDVRATSMHAVVTSTTPDEEPEGLESSMHAVAPANDACGLTMIPRIAVARTAQAISSRTTPTIPEPAVAKKVEMSSIPVRNPRDEGIQSSIHAVAPSSRLDCDSLVASIHALARSRTTIKAPRVNSGRTAAHLGNPSSKMTLPVDEKAEGSSTSVQVGLRSSTHAAAPEPSEAEAATPVIASQSQASSEGHAQDAEYERWYRGVLGQKRNDRRARIGSNIMQRTLSRFEAEKTEKSRP